MSRRTSSSSLFMIAAAAPLALGACGSSKATTDAPIATIDAPAHGIDAPTNTIDAAVAGPDALVQAGCSYNEVSDSTNGTTPEDSGQTLSTAPITLCGSVAANAPDSTSGLVDKDLINFAIATEGDYIFQLSAPTFDETAAFMDFSLTDSMMNGFGGGDFFGGHAVATAHLPAGTYTFEMDESAGAQGALIPYKLVISTDAPNTRCVNLTSGGYAEANDGSGNTGNDMVDIDWNNNGVETHTTATTDSPEATGLTLTAGNSSRITGVSANVTNTDTYFDRDSFNIAVGANTNQLDIRVNWTGTAADFDAVLFPQIAQTDTDDTNFFDVGALEATGETSPEYGALAVDPSTNYTLWIGNFNQADDQSGVDTTPNTFPQNYDITICASNYTAPN